MSTPKQPNRTCEVCGTPFAARPEQLRAGRGRFCSHRCHGTTQVGVRMKRDAVARSVAAREASRAAGRWHSPSGPNHPGWKGGVRTDKSGYRVLTSQQNRREGMGNRYEHRAIMARHVGRPLLASEIVHHINGDKGDNRIENLELTTRSAHGHHHMREIWSRYLRARA